MAIIVVISPGTKACGSTTRDMAAAPCSTETVTMAPEWELSFKRISKEIILSRDYYHRKNLEKLLLYVLLLQFELSLESHTSEHYSNITISDAYCIQ
jgi:hypothetical protein